MQVQTVHNWFKNVIRLMISKSYSLKIFFNDTVSQVKISLTYRIVQNCGRGKLWRIRQFESHSPIFYPAKFTYVYCFEIFEYLDKFLCVRQRRISKRSAKPDVHIEIFSPCEAKTGFTRSLGPLSKLIPSTVINSANLKRHSSLRTCTSCFITCAYNY